MTFFPFAGQRTSFAIYDTTTFLEEQWSLRTPPSETEAVSEAFDSYADIPVPAASLHCPILTQDGAASLETCLKQWTPALQPPPPAFRTRHDIAEDYIRERARNGQSIAIAAKPALDPVPAETLVGHFLENAEVSRRYYSQFADYADTHLERIVKLSAIGDAAAAGVPPSRLEETPWRMWHIRSLSALPSGAHQVPSGMLHEVLARPLGESYVAEMGYGELLHIDATGSITKLPQDTVDAASNINLAKLLAALGLRSADPAPAENQRIEYMVDYDTCDLLRPRKLIVALRRKAIQAAIAQWKTGTR